jgi:HAMP domain-containing protein
MASMFKNLKLGTKLNILLVIIFLGVVLISGLTLSRILEKSAQDKIASQGLLLMETMNSVRYYTDTQVTPKLNPLLDQEPWFIPQVVPSYAAHEVFERLRSNHKQYNAFFYKDATLNPTNLRDKADPFETEIIKRFQKETELKEIADFRSLPSGELFYAARPIVVSEESCLRCHSTPEAAPKSQIATYGRENGFGWKLNEIIGAQIISVPASAVFNEARRLQLLVIGTLIGFLLLTIVLINLFLKFAVTKPLRHMAQLSKQVSTGNMDGDFEHPVNDEIGILAASLNRMKVSLQMAMSMLDTDIQE